MKKFFSLYFLIFISVYLSAQQKNDKIDLSKGTVAEKFDQIYQKSGKYKQYRILEQRSFLKLKNIVLDSLNKEKKRIFENEKKIKEFQEEINELKNELLKSNEMITKLSDERDTINFMGLVMVKNKFVIFIVLLLLILFLALLYFIYAFKNSHKITKASQESLRRLEDEFNDFRSRSLEREQLLKRQLLDERKKHST